MPAESSILKTANWLVDGIPATVDTAALARFTFRILVRPSACQSLQIPSTAKLRGAVFTCDSRSQQPVQTCCSDIVITPRVRPVNHPHPGYREVSKPPNLTP
jgi:hypothetical protein